MITVTPKILRGALKALLKVATKAVNEPQKCIHMAAVSNVLKLAATDGHRIVQVSIDLECPILDFETTIKIQDAKLLAKHEFPTLRWDTGVLYSDFGIVVPHTTEFPPIHKVIPAVDESRRMDRAIRVEPAYMVDAFRTFIDVFGKGEVFGVDVILRPSARLQPIRIDGRRHGIEVLCVVMPKR